MKKLFFGIAIAMFMLYGCGDSMTGIESNFIIKLTGTDGIKFSGNYSFVGTGDVPKPMVVTGTIPFEYTGKGVTAVCFFRKTSEEGTLKVEILNARKVISESVTEIPYGFVTLKTPLPDKNTVISQILRKILGE